MTKANSVVVCGVLLLLLGGIAIGQTGTAPTAAKVVVVKTEAFFDDKAGIASIIAASKKVSADLSEKRTNLQQLIARIGVLEKELTTFRENVDKGLPVDGKTVQAKVDELERLKREGKFQQDEFNAFAQKTQNQIVGPVYADVMKTLGEYIKSKGYDIVFDISKDQEGMLIYATVQYDITKDFIVFYNARPPTTITSVPK
ncbi:MAG: OmpH family outer membrane protein [Pyrinomonadaceae bacterium]